MPTEYSNVDPRVFRMKLFDVASSKVQIDIQITNPFVIGVLSSGYYTLVDGHIYHCNSVIKIRYDLLEAKDNTSHENLSENDFFDIYKNMFPLRPGCRISSSSLLNNVESHRFAFLSEDTRNQALPSVVRISPYLHERRIFLRSRQRNKRYFITAMDLSVQEREQYNQNLYNSIVGQPDEKNSDDSSDVSDYEEKGVQIRRHKRRSKINKLSVIMRMNITESKFHVYS